MAREIVFWFYNSMLYLGFEGVDINTLLSMLKFRSGNPNDDRLLACEPMTDYNQSTAHGRQTFDEGLKLYTWLAHLATQYYMKITKKMYHEHVVNVTGDEAATRLGHPSLAATQPVDFSRPIRLTRRNSVDLEDTRPTQEVSLCAPTASHH